jgi:hypothetical protein
MLYEYVTISIIDLRRVFRVQTRECADKHGEHRQGDWKARHFRLGKRVSI